MNFRVSVPLHSIAPGFNKTAEGSPGPDTKPIFVRSSGPKSQAGKITHGQSRNPAIDGAGAAPFTAQSLGDLRKKCDLAIEPLSFHMKPGDVIDLGRLRQGAAPGYLCRMTASGDGYVVQTHEQARSAPFAGMFLPAADHPNGTIRMDMMPVTDVNQLSPKMYSILHSLGRFLHRQTMGELSMQT